MLCGLRAGGGNEAFVGLRVAALTGVATGRSSELFQLDLATLVWTKFNASLSKPAVREPRRRGGRVPPLRSTGVSSICFSIKSVSADSQAAA